MVVHPPTPPSMSLWERLTVVSSSDPIRRDLNRGFAKILVVWWLLLAFAVMVDLLTQQPYPFIVFASCAWAICSGAWWLNRKGMVIGHLLFATYTGVALTLLTSPEQYAGQEPIIQVAFIGGVIMVTLFVSPRLGLLACVLQLVLLVLIAIDHGIPLPQVRTFAFFGGVTLFGLTALIMVAASTFTRALRTAHEANKQLSLLNTDLEQRVADRTADLQHANHRLETRALLRAKDTDELVHDAAGLLGITQATVELMVYTLPDVQQEHIVATAMPSFYQSIDLVRAMLTSTLDAAQLEAQTMVIDRSDIVDVAEVISKAQFIVQPRFSQFQIGCSVQMDEHLPVIHGDATRLLRVFLNLLLNAAKFTEPYRANTGDGMVGMHVEAMPNGVRITVRDNGPGVPRDALATLSQRFTRAVRGTMAPEGTGIGLHAAAGIIGLHGGTMTIDSPGEGQGFTVTIILPAAVPASART